MKQALLGAVFALAGCAHADLAQVADGATTWAAANNWRLL